MLGFRLGHLAAFLVENHRSELHLRGLGGFVFHLRAQADGGLFLRNLRRRDRSAPVGDMDRVHFHEPDIPIDAGPRIPAAATWLDIGTDGDVVWLTAVFQVGREVVAETHISIGALTQQVPIDPDLAVHVDPVEIQGDFLALVRFGKRERFAIPTDAAGKVADRGTPGHLGIVGLLDAPVVWHIQFPPLGIIKPRHLRTRRLTEMKSPILGE